MSMSISKGSILLLLFFIGQTTSLKCHRIMPKPNNLWEMRTEECQEKEWGKSTCEIWFGMKPDQTIDISNGYFGYQHKCHSYLLDEIEVDGYDKLRCNFFSNQWYISVACTCTTDYCNSINSQQVHLMNKLLKQHLGKEISDWVTLPIDLSTISRPATVNSAVEFGIWDREKYWLCPKSYQCRRP